MVEKLNVKELGPDQPDVKRSQQEKEKGKLYTRRFSQNWYTRKQWLAGCNHANALFCFPCLLFVTAGIHRRWMWNLCLIGDSIPSLTEECSASVQQPTKKRRTFGQGEQQLGAEVILILTKYYHADSTKVLESSLWRSSDYGTTYTKLNLVPGTTIVVTSFYICPTNKRKVVMVGSSVNERDQMLFISTDEGSSFQRQSVDFTPEVMIFHPKEEDKLLAYCKDGRVGVSGRARPVADDSADVTPVKHLHSQCGSMLFTRYSGTQLR
nr:VPS10 domain-containing receptor SorCS1 isoform X2 [Nothobranchius furzeri]